MQKFFNRFIKPLSTEPDQVEREIVLNWLLVGIFILSVVALFDTFLGLFFGHDYDLKSRIINNTFTVFFVAFLYVFARYKHHEKLVGFLLTLLIFIFACFMIYNWGLLVPTGILLCSLAIVMAGILISARSSLYVSLALIVVMIGLQYAKAGGHLKPDLDWMHHSSTAGDVIGFTAIFFVIALVSWLFNRQMELSLWRAKRSEAALKRQKALLEITVQKRTQQLEAAHIEQMQELYRFAELGRLSTALFHDLANHISNVSLGIQGLSGKDKSEIMQHIQEDVGHIDAVVQRVRQQIQGKTTIEAFNVKDEVSEVIKILKSTAKSAGIDVKLADSDISDNLSCKGDTTRFRQLIINLISNAIEAYQAKDFKAPTSKTVTISLERQKTTLIIKVHDDGVGISDKKQSSIFKPFYTTKEKGTGIGLFIVQQIVEHDFGGVIQSSSSKREGTTFTVKLPKSYYVSKNHS